MTRTRLSFPFLFAALATTALASCKAGGPESPFVTLDAEATPLREQFNRDAGKTRVVMLVAPT